MMRPGAPHAPLILAERALARPKSPADAAPAGTRVLPLTLNLTRITSISRPRFLCWAS